MVYRVCLRFNPEEVNRGRKSGCGTWRVVESYLTVFDVPSVLVARGRAGPLLMLAGSRQYRKGVLVNPARLALDYVRGCNA